MRTIFKTVALFVLTSLPVLADPSGSIYSKEIRQEAQEALSYYGFDAGSADGIFGPETHTAIMAYQAGIGGAATGELSRAEMSNLLQRYREDRRVKMEAAAENGLPEPVRAAINFMAQDCETTLEEMALRPGYLQQADLNNDGIRDFLLDGSEAGCSMLCGAANCQVSVLVSTSRGYRQNDFLGSGITPQTFNCLSSGLCEFAR